MLMVAVVVACSGDSGKATTSGDGAAPATEAAQVAVATSTTTPAAPPPPRPDTGTVSPDSALPPPSYASLPGWLVIGGRGFPRHIGDSTDTDPRAYTGVDIDSGIVIFPPSVRWAHVGTGTGFDLLVPNGTVRLYPGGGAEPEPYTGATLLRARALPAVQLRKLPIGWLLPAGQAGAMKILAIRDSIAPDSSTRTWAMDSVRFRLRLTGRTTATLWAAHVGGDSMRVDEAAINHAADADMGVDTDSVLTLDSWRMPGILTAFRLGDPWPVVAIVYSSGYECGNYRLVVFREREITPIDEPHYVECQH